MADFIKLSFLVKAFVEIFEGAAFKNSFILFAFIIDTASELLFFYHFQTFISQWNLFFNLKRDLVDQGVRPGVYLEQEGTESGFPLGMALGSINSASTDFYK